jgi:hypothetical protein
MPDLRTPSFPNNGRTDVPALVAAEPGIIIEWQRFHWMISPVLR